MKFSEQPVPSASSCADDGDHYNGGDDESHHDDCGEDPDTLWICRSARLGIENE